MRKLIAADLFCGAGGTSQGAEQSGAAEVRFALNHWQTAVETHSANFPGAKHVNSRLDQTSPSEAERIDLLFASPECTHHSRARGGRPTSDQQRSGAWDVLKWIEHHRPSWVVVENVVEFRDWGPVGANGRPLESKRGHTFSAWATAIRSLGYKVDDAELNAADYGAATSRNRLFVIARKGNRSPLFPEPTHGKRAGGELPGMELQPWRAAAQIIDWSVPCPSVFARKRPLADKTLLRIEAGLRRFVGPFVAQWDHQSGGGSYTRDISGPLGTFTTKANMGLVNPFITRVAHGEGRWGRSVDDLGCPLGTLTTSKDFALAMPFVVPNFGEAPGQTPRTHSLCDALPCVTSHGAGGLCVPFQMDVNHDGPPRLAPLTEQLGSVTTKNGRAIAVPWLSSFYGNETQSPAGLPVPTITTKDRHSLCVAQVGTPNDSRCPCSAAMRKLCDTMRELGVADIGFRMLQNHELSAAQGFPPSYIFRGTKADVTKQIGNSVSPTVAEAITRTLAG